MRKCVVCERELEDFNFFYDADICDGCITKLKKIDTSEQDVRRHVSIREAYILLLLAIRKQAIRDDELEDFENYWLEDDRMSVLWGILYMEEHE